MLDRDAPTLPGKNRGTHVLLAEDDDPLRELLSSILSLEGHTVIAVPNADEARQKLDAGEVPFDVIVTDVRMPGTSALDFVDRLRTEGHDVPVIVMTAFPDDGIRKRALSLGTVLVAKPFSLEAMCITVDWLLEATSGRNATSWMH